ncbi:hypothetical protein AAY473_023457 [Plecturocebus cupreus]
MVSGKLAQQKMKPGWLATTPHLHIASYHSPNSSGLQGSAVGTKREEDAVAIKHTSAQNGHLQRHCLAVTGDQHPASAIEGSAHIRESSLQDVDKCPDQMRMLSTWTLSLSRRLCNFCLPDSSDSHASASQVAGTTDLHHHARLIFAFLVETGFCHFGQAGLQLRASKMGFLHVGQACLELPTSGDPSALASQSAGITGVRHCAWLCVNVKNEEQGQTQDGVSLCFPGWSRTPEHKESSHRTLLKRWDYRHEPPQNKLFLK